MSLTAKTVQSKIRLLKPLMKIASLETVRHCQNKLGELMETRYRRELLTKEHIFDNFTAAWLLPRDTRREGVVLYLHGGGYVCGGLEYARAFGAMVAVRCGVRVLAPAYRLAPEHPYPAALEDALESYRYLLSKGYEGEKIALCGESAGGGLCYSLCLKLKELGLPLPGGIIAISPWTDLTWDGELLLKGSGVIRYEDGSWYDGQIVKNLRHGQGTYTLADGTVLQGRFRENEFLG